MDRDGRHVPKQFCTIDGTHTLLDFALRRTDSLADAGRTLVSVRERHRQWWSPLLAQRPAANVIRQPANRGTGFGILVPLLAILERDPDATVLFVPADHYVRDEDELARAMRSALEIAEKRPDTVAVVGIEPERPEGDFGYIVPRPDDGSSVSRVLRFVEKPGIAAESLVSRGALWNTFIFAGKAATLRRMFARRVGAAARELGALVEDAAGDTARLCRSLASAYESLTTLDFSRDVLEPEAAHLVLVRAADCGWSDLGNRERIAAWQREHGEFRRAADSAEAGRHGAGRLVTRRRSRRGGLGHLRPAWAEARQADVAETQSRALAAHP